MTIDFACKLRIAFSRWFRALPLPVPMPVPVAAPLPLVEARPVVLLDRLPHPRRGRVSRGTFIIRGVGYWDAPPADLRPYIHPAAPDGGLLPERR